MAANQFLDPTKLNQVQTYYITQFEKVDTLETTIQNLGSTYLALTGGTVTGAVLSSFDYSGTVADNAFVTKSYVTSMIPSVTGYMPTTGGQFTGDVTTTNTTFTNTSLVTKNYVDSAISLSSGWDNKTYYFNNSVDNDSVIGTLYDNTNGYYLGFFYNHSSDDREVQLPTISGNMANGFNLDFHNEYSYSGLLITNDMDQGEDGISSVKIKFYGNNDYHGSAGYAGNVVKAQLNAHYYVTKATIDNVNNYYRQHWIGDFDGWSSTLTESFNGYTFRNFTSSKSQLATIGEHFVVAYKDGAINNNPDRELAANYDQVLAFDESTKDFYIRNSKTVSETITSNMVTFTNTGVISSKTTVADFTNDNEFVTKLYVDNHTPDLSGYVSVVDYNDLVAKLNDFLLETSGVEPTSNTFSISATANTTVTVTFNQAIANGLIIDWGDGKTDSQAEGTSNVTLTHTYTNTNTYYITFTEATGGNVTIASITGVTVTSANIVDIDVTAVGTGLTKVYTNNNVSASYFNDNTNLTSAIIGSNVTTIGATPFSGCTSLTRLVIKGNAVTLDGKLFASSSETIPTGFKIYVPAGTGATYKEATNWSDYATYIEEM